jgi:hypothetical protein
MLTQGEDVEVQALASRAWPVSAIARSIDRHHSPMAPSRPVTPRRAATGLGRRRWPASRQATEQSVENLRGAACGSGPRKSCPGWEPATPRNDDLRAAARIVDKAVTRSHSAGRQFSQVQLPRPLTRRDSHARFGLCGYNR